jgi:hypothetical protein
MSDLETDDEYIETNYEDFDNFDDFNDFYEPEEISLTKFNLVVCERYNPIYHGISTQEMNYHYLIHMRLKTFSFNNMVINGNTSKLEIAECITLFPSLHCIAIFKTFWLKIVQRKWKNVLKERDFIIKTRCHPNSLKYREINGKWPRECFYYPILKGMLSNLYITSSRTF